MNLGQIYETILGWAGQELGKKYFTPVFDGASIDQIDAETDEAGLPRLGQLICSTEVQVNVLNKLLLLVLSTCLNLVT
jgi:hypothetical protein